MTEKEGKALTDRIEKHLGHERIAALANEISRRTEHDGYGESIDPALAATILVYTLFCLMQDEKIALITRDES